MIRTNESAQGFGELGGDAGEEEEVERERERERGCLKTIAKKQQ